MYLSNLVDAYPDEVHVFAPADTDAELHEKGVTRGSRSYMLPTLSTAKAITKAATEFGRMRSSSAHHTRFPSSAQNCASPSARRLGY